VNTTELKKSKGNDYAKRDSSVSSVTVSDNSSMYEGSYTTEEYKSEGHVDFKHRFIPGNMNHGYQDNRGEYPFIAKSM